MAKVIHLSPEKKDKFDTMYAGMAMNLTAKRLKAWEEYYKTVKDFDLFLECFEFDAKANDYKFAIIPRVRARYNSLLRAKSLGTVTTKADHDHHDEVAFLIKDCAGIQAQIDATLSKKSTPCVFRTMAISIFRDNLERKKLRVLELQEIGADARLAKNPNYLCARCRTTGWLHIAIGGSSPHHAKPINHTKNPGTFAYITQMMIPCECKKGCSIMLNSKHLSLSGDRHRHLIAEYVFKSEAKAVTFVIEHKRKVVL